MKTINHYTDFGNAEKLAKNYDAVISLGIKLGEEHLNKKTKYLFLDFEDIDNAMIYSNPNDIDGAPTEGHIYELVRFINELEPTDSLLIHCLAGYSRSPAAVIIAKCERDGLSLWKATEDIKDNRVPDKLTPNPNSLILNHYSNMKILNK